MEAILGMDNSPGCSNFFFVNFKCDYSISTQVFIGLALTCIASFISIIAHFQNNDKFFKELFTEFNARYDLLNNFLNSMKEDQKLTTEERQKIIDYLNLVLRNTCGYKKDGYLETFGRAGKMALNSIKEKFL